MSDFLYNLWTMLYLYGLTIASPLNICVAGNARVCARSIDTRSGSYYICITVVCVSRLFNGQQPDFLNVATNNR